MSDSCTGAALGEERRMIFENYVNGCDIEQMKQPFRRSASEIEREIFFVAKKINEYRFRHCSEGSKFGAPPLPAGTLAEIRLNRLAMLDTLRKLGPLYLSSALLIPKVRIQTVESGYIDGMREINHRINHA